MTINQPAKLPVASQRRLSEAMTDPALPAQLRCDIADAVLRAAGVAPAARGVAK